MEKRACPECGETVKGRIDKRFCSDACRNAYNNRQNSDTHKYMRNVNNILRKNRRILSELNPKDKVSVHRSKLTKHGFNFNYFTNIYKTRQGKVYYFCYEQGYLALDNDFFMLVLREEYVT